MDNNNHKKKHPASYSPEDHGHKPTMMSTQAAEDHHLLLSTNDYNMDDLMVIQDIAIQPSTSHQNILMEKWAGFAGHGVSLVLYTNNNQ